VHVKEQIGLAAERRHRFFDAAVAFGPTGRSVPPEKTMLSAAMPAAAVVQPLTADTPSAGQSRCRPDTRLRRS